ncbi:M949_RS01915 family surface polysaccharide biosynthesis protein [Aquimarina sp. 2201CG14-23]|uniref:M949_RS01915 family surface polysaccharide biosynthesis protein n=1 Tax=Aquimarina mycalae TaxID=3040073 RepID=UPI002477DE00|nr:hypothetical protein [Aquimarina sp. 2201CG14-23]MDH7444252.1 hypothetical protein [Aquimarina sp. 2201CG14-23]
MNRFLLSILFLTFFSCGKQTKESTKDADNQTAKPETVIALPIQRHATIPMDTALVRKLSNKELTSIFTTNRQIKLGISNKVYQAYTYKDTSSEYYLLLTDHNNIINEEKDTLYDNVYALNLTSKNYQFKKRSTIKGEIDEEWETSIGFWNQYSQLSDLDKDGSIDPIIVYGTTTQSMYEDGRVRIIAYYKKKRVTIKHQNSEIPDGRLTKINKNFYKFPVQIQEAVKEKMRLMTKNGHAVFAEGWEKSMDNKATRLENN